MVTHWISSSKENIASIEVMSLGFMKRLVMGEFRSVIISFINFLNLVCNTIIILKEN